MAGAAAHRWCRRTGFLSGGFVGGFVDTTSGENFGSDSVAGLCWIAESGASPMRGGGCVPVPSAAFPVPWLAAPLALAAGRGVTFAGAQPEPEWSRAPRCTRAVMRPVGLVLTFWEQSVGSCARFACCCLQIVCSAGADQCLLETNFQEHAVQGQCE